MRIGYGYDMHRFGENDFITLGGVRIPRRHRLVVRSDDDVLLRASSDAPLGTAALDDIGKHSSGTDPRFKGADSYALLRHVIAIVAEKGWRVDNVDATIITQAPRTVSHIETMCGSIAEDLGVAVDQVNIEVTTTEQLGFTGREEGITVHAAALLVAR